MNNNNIFKKIINNKIKSYKIIENYDNIAILDIHPIKYGHTLVIPKNINTDNIFNISEKDYISLMIFTKKIALGLKKSIKCKRIGLFIMGFDVPHVHIHLIPINKESDIDFSKKRKTLSEEKFLFLLNKIKKLLIF